MVAQLRSSRRNDGAATQAQLLEAAGKVIAAKGIDRATGKEIAERAGTSTNAINYYFGGMESLYREVLLEAHRSLATLEELAEISGRDVSSEEKLRQFLAVGVTAAMQPRGPSWALRVVSRELLAPTPVGLSLRELELLPKKQVVLGILAEVLGRDVEDPLVERCGFSVLAPIMMLLVADPESRRADFPSIADGAVGAEALAAHLFAFALGGLRAAAAGGTA